MVPGMIVGGALGALGGLVGYGLARLFSSLNDLDEIPRWPSVVCLALALTLSRPLTVWLNKPTAESVLQDLEKGEPLYGALKANYPQEYSKIRQVIFESIEDGDVASAKPKIRAIAFALIARELPNASDDTLFSFASLVRDEGMALANEHPDACVALFKGGAPDPQLFLTPAMNARENGIYNRLFSEHMKGGDVASDAQAGAYIQKLGQNLQRQLGVSGQQLGDALQYKGPIGLQCQANVAFFDGFTKAWSNDNGPEVLRAILQKRVK